MRCTPGILALFYRPPYDGPYSTLSPFNAAELAQDDEAHQRDDAMWPNASAQPVTPRAISARAAIRD
jgi:hypothetical protein